jgi:1,4-dihydroxy-2-naphthoyl-CoA synthase
MITRLTNGMSEPTIIVEHSERVGIIKLNRPRAYNALSGTLINELLDALRSFDDNPNIGAIILTGNEKGFCGQLRNLSTRINLITSQLVRISRSKVNYPLSMRTIKII